MRLFVYFRNSNLCLDKVQQQSISWILLTVKVQTHCLKADLLMEGIGSFNSRTSAITFWAESWNSLLVGLSHPGWWVNDLSCGSLLCLLELHPFFDILSWRKEQPSWASLWVILKCHPQSQHLALMRPEKCPQYEEHSVLAEIKYSVVA